MGWFNQLVRYFFPSSDWTARHPTPRFKVDVNNVLIPKPDKAHFTDGKETDLSRRTQEAWQDYYISYQNEVNKPPVSKAWTQSSKKPSSSNISKRTPSKGAARGRGK